MGIFKNIFRKSSSTSRVESKSISSSEPTASQIAKDILKEIDYKGLNSHFYDTRNKFVSDAHYILANLPEKKEEEIMLIFSRLKLGRTNPLRSSKIDKVISEFEAWVNRISSKADFTGKYQIEGGQGKLYLSVELKKSMATFKAYPFKEGWIYWY